MSIKMCAYKNCSNYSVNNVSCGTEDLSFFGFPKDPSRREEWLELAKVKRSLAEEHGTSLYMCSKHFDPKFISKNQRRWVLIGAATPFPATEDKSQEDLERSLTYLVREESPSGSEQDEFQESNLQVESAMPDDEYGNIIQDVESIDSDPGNNFVEEFSSNSLCVKRENQQQSLDEPKPKVMKVLLKNVQVCPTAKNLKNRVELKTRTTVTKPKLKHQLNSPIETESTPSEHLMQKVEIDEDALVSGKDVTTFIFKGEEYIQMPKACYVQEKIAFMQKIQQYQSILTSFKKQLNTLNLS